MRKIIVSSKGLLKVNNTYQSESIEKKLAKKMEGEETDIQTKDLKFAYTRAEDGVIGMTDIRFDKREMLMMANDAIARKAIMKGNEFLEKKEKEKETKQITMNPEGGESTAGKN